MVLPVIIYFTMRFRLQARDSYRAVRVRLARINAFLNEHIMGMGIIQLFSREAREQRRFDELNRDHLDANLTALRSFADVPPDGRRHERGRRGRDPRLRRQPGAGWRRSASAWSWPSSSTRSVSSIRSRTWPRNTTSSRRRWRPPSASSACWMSRSRSQDPSSPARVERVRGEIEFRDVWFAYEPAASPGAEDWVLRGISFHIQPGESVALVGAHRRRQDLDHQPDHAVLRRRSGARY